MSTVEAIKKQEQQVARLERNLALQKIKQRKTETRRKIELGGLVVKSGMHQYSKAVVLGALVDALSNLENDDTVRTLFQAKGEAVFMGYGEKDNDKSNNTI